MTIKESVEQLKSTVGPIDKIAHGIYIKHIITLMSDEWIISTSNKELNKAISKNQVEALSRFGWPVGYELYNATGKTIEHIKCPEYSKNSDGIYTGKIVEKSLPYSETILLPTKYAVALLMDLQKSLEVENGKLTPISLDRFSGGKVEEEITGSAFSFVPVSEFSEYFNSKEGILPIGYKLVQNKQILPGVYIVEPKYVKIFGNLENYMRHGENTTNNNIQISLAAKVLRYFTQYKK